MALFGTFNAVCSGGYQPLATEMDGASADLLTWSSLSGVSATSTGILMLWVNPHLLVSGGPGLFTCGGLSVGISGTFPFTDHRAVVSLVGSGGILSFQSNANLTTANVWRQILCSWNTNFSTGNRLYTMVINGTVSTALVTDSGNAFDVTYGAASLGFRGNNSNGCLSEFYFAPGQYLDLTQASNRAKFVTPGGEPVYMGSDGSAPTGLAPAIYLKNPSTSYNINSGTGGNAVITGTLSPCGSAP